MRKFVPRGPTHRWLYGLLVGFGSTVWAHACLTPQQGALSPPTLPPASSAAPDLPGEVSGYFAPSGGDSGSDGNGGVKLLVNDQKHLPLVRSDYAAKQKGDAATKQHPDWLLFFAPSGPPLRTPTVFE